MPRRRRAACSVLACSTFAILCQIAQWAHVTSDSSHAHAAQGVWIALATKFDPREEELLPAAEHEAGAPLRGTLQQLEFKLTRRWNNSAASFVVLGQKAVRDFGVFAWSFRVHGYKLTAPSTGYLNLTPGPPNTPPFKGVGAMLCHSLFLSNCIHGYRGISKQSDGGIYSRLRGMKFNRIAGVRQVLSTKDGLCHTLQGSGLSTAQLSQFTFPCWVLPAHSTALANHVVGELSFERTGLEPSVVESPDDRETRGRRNETVKEEQRALYIVKPARGSQGQGIRLFGAAHLAAQLQKPEFLRALRSPLVVQPYLREPLLHNQRKWDVRTYVLATSVLPMRLYLFSEAIVRFAVAANYNATSSDVSSMLTNTFVGKQLLKGGVGAITASLADLCQTGSILSASRAGSGASRFGSRGTLGEGMDTSVSACSASLLDGMRDAVGRLMLAAEPRLKQYYHEQYAHVRSGADWRGTSYGRNQPMPAGRHDEGELSDADSSDRAFRCSECYHLFGVDLIADSTGRFHVIEVNVSPDLSLSTEGACQAVSGCKGGSTAYDHTKLAVGYNTVQLVYARQSAASQLDSILRRHAEAISRLQLLTVPRREVELGIAGGRNSSSNSQARHAPMLQTDVVDYVLGVIRERANAGCFAPVYPSALHHATHGEHIERIARGASKSSHDAMRRRVQFHKLLGIVIAEIDNTSHRGFSQRCDQMLRRVPRVRYGEWARRTHIFKQPLDLEP